MTFNPLNLNTTHWSHFKLGFDLVGTCVLPACVPTNVCKVRDYDFKKEETMWEQYRCRKVVYLNELHLLLLLLF